jgi:hypothetical protein
MLGMDAARRSYWKSYGGAPGLSFLLTDFRRQMHRSRSLQQFHRSAFSFIIRRRLMLFQKGNIMKNFKIAGISFDHMHMGDLLRQVHEYSGAEICGICDDNPANQESVQRVVANFDIPRSAFFKITVSAWRKLSLMS